VIFAYLASGGDLAAQKGLVAGYDFLTDCSLQIEATLQGYGLTTNRLIGDTWTRQSCACHCWRGP